MKDFKDATAVKECKTSQNFVAPTKEKATTGRFMSAGDDYGVGHRTPIGGFKASGIMSGPIPMKSKRMNPDEI